MEIMCREVRPYPALSMSQICFWLRIMKEHALFINLGLPCDQAELKAEAQGFYNTFQELERCSQTIGCDKDFECYVETIMVAVKKIFAFKRHLLHLLIECRICGGGNYPLLIDHISREALYFFKLLGKIRDGEMCYPMDAIVSENVFWIRIMADHLKFIRGLVDPSEREVLDKVQSLSDRFDQLNLHARDLESILWQFHPTNDFIRFEENVVAATTEVRDFKAAAEKLIEECAALTLIPPLLADHVRREAEHFLEILELIQCDIMEYKHSPIIYCDDSCLLQARK